MLLERLTLCDFGVFRGRHVFELMPGKRYGRNCPIVLFGGLNGAGKTTVLTGVRLALYGRGSLGLAVSQREYSDFLIKSIHRDVRSLVPGNSASVGLEFEHSQLGDRRHYRIERSWTERGSACSESLTVLQDGREIAGLSHEQAQGFLNQLVPPGVSQFFFFDGEKIASLATDGGDQALRESIRRLLGLDLVERLRGDLANYLRQSRGKQPTLLRAEIDALSAELEGAKQSIKAGEIRFREEIVPAVDRAKQTLETIDAEISARGGAWGKNRSAVLEKVEQLIQTKAGLESQIRDAVSNYFPLSLAPKLALAVAKQLDNENISKHATVTRSVLRERIETLRARLTDSLPKRYGEEIKRITANIISEFEKSADAIAIKPIHELGGSAGQSVTAQLTSRLGPARAECLELVRQLEGVEDQLTELNLQLVRAPSESALRSEFDAFAQAGIELGRLQQERSAFVTDLRRQMWQCVEMTRKLRGLEEQASSSWSTDQAQERAIEVRELMSEFSKDVTRLKIDELRGHFVHAFGRLARKEDLVADAEINEEDFSVTLIDRRGRRVPKEGLSAGERQIYAIAMLEALAKTSGRNLPVIIDTPLGRLDSKHRQRLVDNYFPFASHQVIVLSTDTEVDEPFYTGLARHVSHAYHLVFDGDAGATRTAKGYFWKHVDEDVRDVA